MYTTYEQIIIYTTESAVLLTRAISWTHHDTVQHKLTRCSNENWRIAHFTANNRLFWYKSIISRIFETEENQ